MNMFDDGLDNKIFKLVKLSEDTKNDDSKTHSSQD